MRCCFCDEIIIGYGHNPAPVIKDVEARCCEKCNSYIVIPARIFEFQNRKDVSSDKC